MRKTDPKSDVVDYRDVLKKIQKVSPLAQVLEQIRNTAPSPRLAPIRQADDSKSCRNCVHFTIPLGSRSALDRGGVVYGDCAYWNEPVSAEEVSEGHDPGYPNYM